MNLEVTQNIPVASAPSFHAVLNIRTSSLVDASHQTEIIILPLINEFEDLLLTCGLESRLQELLKMSTDSFSTTLLLDITFITIDGGFRECLWSALSNLIFDNRTFLLRDVAIDHESVRFAPSSRNACMSNNIFATSFGTFDDNHILIDCDSVEEALVRHKEGFGVIADDTSSFLILQYTCGRAISSTGLSNLDRLLRAK